MSAQKEFSWSFVIFSHCAFHDWTHLSQSQEIMEGKFNPGNLPMCVSSIFNFLLSLSMILLTFQRPQEKLIFVSCAEILLVISGRERLL